MADWLTEFPEMSRSDLVVIRKAMDGAYRDFSRSYGEAVETFFDPLLAVLKNFEWLLVNAPWWLILTIIVGLVWAASRSWKLCTMVTGAMLAVGYFGMWEDAMQTTSIIVVSTAISILIGIPIGILMSRSDRTQAVVTPALDVMQTMPAFVYLIPVVMLLGIGRVPGLIAVVIYAIPPVIRLTNLGIRLVDKEVTEAARSYGASSWQRLVDVQLPLAMPTIMAGINQTIMMALAMVVIASMIGVQGLGQPVLKSITNQYFTMGLLNGLAIVALAIIFDRVSQAFAKRTQAHMHMTGPH